MASGDSSRRAPGGLNSPDARREASIVGGDSPQDERTRLIKLAMRNVYTRLQRENRPSRMLLQVHDELVFETPATAAEADAAIIREEMTGAMTLDVPLKVEIGWGKNWQEVK